MVAEAAAKTAIGRRAVNSLTPNNLKLRAMA